MASANRKMKRPGVLAIGGCLVIKIEETAIIMESIKTIESAIGLLVAYYFILDAAYPDALLNVFSFLELVFRFLEERKCTQSAKNLWDVVGLAMI